MTAESNTLKIWKDFSKTWDKNDDASQPDYELNLTHSINSLKLKLSISYNFNGSLRDPITFTKVGYDLASLTEDKLGRKFTFEEKQKFWWQNTTDESFNIKEKQDMDRTWFSLPPSFIFPKSQNKFINELNKLNNTCKEETLITETAKPEINSYTSGAIEYLYIYRNPVHAKNVHKVGKSNDPELRGLELSSSTSSPAPFSLIASLETKDSILAEKIAFIALDKFRVKSEIRREFFLLKVESLIKVLSKSIELADMIHVLS